MTKLCIKIHVKSDSAIESAFPYILSYLAFPCCRSDAKRLTVWDKNDCVLLFFSRCTMPVEAAQTEELRELVKSSCRLNKIPIFIFPITLGLC